MRALPTVCVLTILGMYTVGSVRYASVWQSELTLWMWAVELAPQKPRPHEQLALALIEARRFTEAQIVLDDLQQILDTNHTIPTWDRQEASAALLNNRLLLARLAGPTLKGRP